MKKYISILFVVGLLSSFIPQPCLAQDEITEYVAEAFGHNGAQTVDVP